MCCLDLLCCCFGPAACGLCCFGNKVRSSITTRLLYMTFLILVLVVSAIMLAPSVQQGLANAVSIILYAIFTSWINVLQWLFQHFLCIPVNLSVGTFATVPPWVPSALVPTISLNALVPCNMFVGYIAVYRVCMAVASFFLLLMLVMFCVFSSKDPRSYIQNG